MDGKFHRAPPCHWYRLARPTACCASERPSDILQIPRPTVTLEDFFSKTQRHGEERLAKLGTFELQRERLALQVFGEMCALPRSERAARMADRCGHDHALQRRVESLLGADDAP